MPQACSCVTEHIPGASLSAVYIIQIIGDPLPDEFLPYIYSAVDIDRSACAVDIVGHPLPNLP